jgi:hypothetical protein
VFLNKKKKNLTSRKLQHHRVLGQAVTHQVVRLVQVVQAPVVLVRIQTQVLALSKTPAAISPVTVSSYTFYRYNHFF